RQNRGYRRRFALDAMEQFARLGIPDEELLLILSVEYHCGGERTVGRKRPGQESHVPFSWCRQGSDDLLLLDVEKLQRELGVRSGLEGATMSSVRLGIGRPKLPGRPIGANCHRPAHFERP